MNQDFDLVKCVSTNNLICTSQERKISCIHREERNTFIQLNKQMNLFKEGIVALKQGLTLNSEKYSGHLIMRKYKITTKIVPDISKMKVRDYNVRDEQGIYISAILRSSRMECGSRKF